jgi:tRNA U34 5-methylaminomethyl-2-thiouridine-forming methyltransferase MnmC
MQHQQAKLEWHDTGVPVSKQFDDPYFSLENGLEETRHVFLSGNGLPARFTDGFHIAELGFGTGLNLLASWQAWRDYGCSGKLYFTSFELFPMDPDEMAKSLDLFPVDQDLAGRMVAALHSGETRIETDDLVFNLVIGDARKSVPAWQASADAWFLDGFSPAKNPELWEAGLMNAVFQHTNPNGSAATYTAAGAVRRALADAGFEVERIKGFGRKRHMTIAKRTTR